MTPKERIIKAATELFATAASDNVPVRAIASAAKVNPAAISYYFGSKDGLIDTIKGKPPGLAITGEIATTLIDNGCSLTEDARALIHSILRKHKLVA